MGAAVTKSLYRPPNPRTYEAYSFPNNLVWIPQRNRRKPPVPCLFVYNPRAEFLLITAHGNACDLGGLFPEVCYFGSRLPVHVLAVEYPGYGLFPGTPSEESFNAAMRSVFDYVTTEMQYPAHRVILLGRSLGTAPMTQLAATLSKEGPTSTPAALVLISPFSSIKSVVNDIVGTSFFISQRWNTESAISSVTCPLLLIHGRDDDFIKPFHSEALYAAARATEAKVLYLCDADHDNFCYHHDIVTPILSLLDTYVYARVPHPATLLSEAGLLSPAQKKMLKLAATTVADDDDGLDLPRRLGIEFAYGSDGNEEDEDESLDGGVPSSTPRSHRSNEKLAPSTIDGRQYSRVHGTESSSTSSLGDDRNQEESDDEEEEEALTRYPAIVTNFQNPSLDSEPEDPMQVNDRSDDDEEDDEDAATFLAHSKLGMKLRITSRSPPPVLATIAPQKKVAAVAAAAAALRTAGHSALEGPDVEGVRHLLAAEGVSSKYAAKLVQGGSRNRNVGDGDDEEDEDEDDEDDDDDKEEEEETGAGADDLGVDERHKWRGANDLQGVAEEYDEEQEEEVSEVPAKPYEHWCATFDNEDAADLAVCQIADQLENELRTIAEPGPAAPITQNATDKHTPALSSPHDPSSPSQITSTTPAHHSINLRPTPVSSAPSGEEFGGKPLVRLSSDDKIPNIWELPSSPYHVSVAQYPSDPKDDDHDDDGGDDDKGSYTSPRAHDDGLAFNTSPHHDCDDSESEDGRPRGVRLRSLPPDFQVSASPSTQPEEVSPLEQLRLQDSANLGEGTFKIAASAQTFREANSAWLLQQGSLRIAPLTGAPEITLPRRIFQIPHRYRVFFMKSLKSNGMEFQVPASWSKNRKFMDLPSWPGTSEDDLTSESSDNSEDDDLVDTIESLYVYPGRQRPDVGVSEKSEDPTLYESVNSTFDAGLDPDLMAELNEEASSSMSSVTLTTRSTRTSLSILSVSSAGGPRDATSSVDGSDGTGEPLRSRTAMASSPESQRYKLTAVSVQASREVHMRNAGRRGHSRLPDASSDSSSTHDLISSSLERVKTDPVSPNHQEPRASAGDYGEHVYGITHLSADGVVSQPLRRRTSTGAADINAARPHEPQGTPSKPSVVAGAAGRRSSIPGRSLSMGLDSSDNPNRDEEDPANQETKQLDMANCEIDQLHGASTRPQKKRGLLASLLAAASNFRGKNKRSQALEGEMYSESSASVGVPIEKFLQDAGTGQLGSLADISSPAGQTPQGAPHRSSSSSHDHRRAKAQRLRKTDPARWVQWIKTLRRRRHRLEEARVAWQACQAELMLKGYPIAFLNRFPFLRLYGPDSCLLPHASISRRQVIQTDQQINRAQASTQSPQLSPEPNPSPSSSPITSPSLSPSDPAYRNTSVANTRPTEVSISYHNDQHNYPLLFPADFSEEGRKRLSHKSAALYLSRLM